MTTSILLGTLLAIAAPVPPVPANQAPPPHLVKPEVSLVVIEWLPGGLEHPNRTRLQLLGFRRGTMLPPETVWEGEEGFLNDVSFRPQLVNGRWLVAHGGGVIDLRERKVLSSEQDGEVVDADEKAVRYQIQRNGRVEGLFSFDYATGTVTRLGNLPPRGWRYRVPSPSLSSPDGKSVIYWENDELILYREGEKPKSLGKGFKMEEDPNIVFARSLAFFLFPVLWLDSSTLLTQRDHGKLVTVDLAGKVTEVATIKNAPKQDTPRLERDISGAIFYRLDGRYYRVDVAKKTAERSEWYSLGHGFETTWKGDENGDYYFRHNGKDLGRRKCFPYGAVTAPGYLAVVMEVWSSATGEWNTHKYEWLSPIPFFGWIPEAPKP
jgi:hypothetical protein